MSEVEYCVHTPHSLRATTATLLLDAGVDIKKVQDLLDRSVLFRTASELISDLSCDSPQLRKRKLRLYGRVDLLCIDEVGYLAYDSHAADLLYEVVNRRYESGAIIMTTNRSFKDWNEVFLNATSIGTMCDRLLHHADVVVIEGSSYRRRESEAEKAARRSTP